MCGIAGFWQDPASRIDRCAVIRDMADAIQNRGPDDHGYWSDGESGIVLGHRRLSIIDLSVHGHQPMTSSSGRYVIVFNGEIYNFPELRRELEALRTQFRGHSDTEVMLAAMDHWGLTEAVRRFAGMFAFAVYDRETRHLHLVRDRLGEKPLYYGWGGQTLLFGSELKALGRHPDWRGEIDRGALALFLRHGYVPAPYSIYKGIRKVPPASIVSFPTGRPGTPPTTVPYWSPRDIATAGTTNPANETDEDLTDELDRLLRRTIRREMVADVPLGAFLSGGIDSSLIVALMQAESSRPVQTFTIGFRENVYNEAHHAKAVAEHLGTDHTELYVTPEEALKVIPRLPAIYDEPFADSSQIPTALVSELARRRVTVSLSGDGGDELFGGYDRYFANRRLWNKLSSVPRPLRRAMARGIRVATSRDGNGLVKRLQRMAPGRLRDPMTRHRIQWLGDILALDTFEGLYHNSVSHWTHPGEVTIGGVEPDTSFTDPSRWAAVEGLVPRMMYLDMVSYLPDDIMVKVDRASMAVSLESRAPFLDHDVVEFAWRVPQSMRVRGDRGKWILRNLLDRYVPRSLIERPKRGFSVPIDEWLRGPLKDWAANLLDENVLRDDGFFEPAPILQRWSEHQSGACNWKNMLWNVLMFQAWRHEQ